MSRKQFQETLLKQFSSLWNVSLDFYYQCLKDSGHLGHSCDLLTPHNPSKICPGCLMHSVQN